MIIDFHTHTFPDKIAANAIAKMQASSHSVAFTDGTESALRTSMKAAGICRSVVLPVATNPLKVGHINDISIRMQKDEELTYFGCIHPAMEDAEAELERIAAAGLKGIKIHPFFQNADIDDPRYLQILRKAGALGLIVVTHAGDDIGFPGQVRCSPQMIRNALDRVGGLPLVLAHMGGWKNWKDVCTLLSDTDIYLDTAFSLGEIVSFPENYYNAEQRKLLSAERFCQMAELFGSERILFGTDCPWDDQTVAVRRIQALPLDEKQKQDILSDNAKKLLHI